MADQKFSEETHEQLAKIFAKAIRRIEREKNVRVVLDISDSESPESNDTNKD